MLTRSNSLGLSAIFATIDKNQQVPTLPCPISNLVVPSVNKAGF